MDSTLQPLIPQFQGIAVTGEATRRIVPDLAEITVGVQSSNRSAAIANRETVTKMLQIVQALMAKGVAQDDIQTSGASLQPLYMLTQPQPGQSQPAGASYPPINLGENNPAIGYCCCHSVRITSRDLARSGDIVDTAVNTGANFGIAITLRVHDEGTVRRVLLEHAIREARSKAELLASSVGKAIGEPLALTGDTVAINQPGDQLLRQSSIGASAVPNTAFISAGEILFIARVQITYRLEG
jgi:uncharacterized protein